MSGDDVVCVKLALAAVEATDCAIDGTVNWASREEGRPALTGTVALTGAWGTVATGLTTANTGMTLVLGAFAWGFTAFLIVVFTESFILTLFAGLTALAESALDAALTPRLTTLTGATALLELLTTFLPPDLTGDTGLTRGFALDMRIALAAGLTLATALVVLLALTALAGSAILVAFTALAATLLVLVFAFISCLLAELVCAFTSPSTPRLLRSIRSGGLEPDPGTRPLESIPC